MQVLDRAATVIGKLQLRFSQQVRFFTDTGKQLMVPERCKKIKSHTPDGALCRYIVSMRVNPSNSVTAGLSLGRKRSSSGISTAKQLFVSEETSTPLPLLHEAVA
jgi:cytochrome b